MTLKYLKKITELENKKAEIHIICSNTDFEKKRIETALMFFDENKILKM